MNLNYFENLVEQKLLVTHTCYLAKVNIVNGEYATIQPLSIIKGTNGKEKYHAPIEDVPICKHVVGVAAGSTVLVVCCERDISRTRKGEFALPSLRHHSLSDSVIIGLMPEVVT